MKLNVLSPRQLLASASFNRDVDAPCNLSLELRKEIRHHPELAKLASLKAEEVSLLVFCCVVETLILFQILKLATEDNPIVVAMIQERIVTASRAYEARRAAEARRSLAEQRTRHFEGISAAVLSNPVSEIMKSSRNETMTPSLASCRNVYES